MSAAMRKLTALISKARTVCIFTNQIREKIGVMFGNPETTPGGRALKFFASVRVDIRRIGQIKATDGTVTGNRTKIKIVKNKVAPPFTEAEFDIMYNEGISSTGSLLDLALEMEIIQKRGSWFSYNGTQLAQGRDAAKELIKGDEDGAVVVSAIEHSAVLRGAEDLPRPVKYAPVRPNGQLDLEKFAVLLPGAAMVSVMAANNETGVLQPIHEASRMARERGLPMHSDAVQLAGKTDIDVRQLGVDFLSLSAHKFHGPNGVGALYVRRGIRFFPMMKGGTQENGRRAGTENVAGIVGMGAAAAAMRRLAGEHSALHLMRDSFESKLLAELPGVMVNGDPVQRLPNTSHLSFEGCEAVDLIRLLDEAGVECSAGSACMAGKIRPSHVQLAMGLDGARGRSSLRFSFSMLNEAAEAWQAAELVKQAVERLRQGTGPGLASSACGVTLS
jgi:cysteine desulfurase